MSDDVEQIDNVIQIAYKNGIATRNDCAALDAASFCLNLLTTIRSRKIDDLEVVFAHLEDYSDFTYALFDTSRFWKDEAEQYVTLKILKPEFMDE